MAVGLCALRGLPVRRPAGVLGGVSTPPCTGSDGPREIEPQFDSCISVYYVRNYKDPREIMIVREHHLRAIEDALARSPVCAILGPRQSALFQAPQTQNTADSYGE
jgi:hypothetical protein